MSAQRVAAVGSASVGIGWATAELVSGCGQWCWMPTLSACVSSVPDPHTVHVGRGAVVHVASHRAFAARKRVSSVSHWLSPLSAPHQRFGVITTRARGCDVGAIVPERLRAGRVFPVEVTECRRTAVPGLSTHPRRDRSGRGLRRPAYRSLSMSATSGGTCSASKRICPQRRSSEPPLSPVSARDHRCTPRSSFAEVTPAESAQHFIARRGQHGLRNAAGYVGQCAGAIAPR